MEKIIYLYMAKEEKEKAGLKDWLGCHARSFPVEKKSIVFLGTVLDGYEIRTGQGFTPPGSALSQTPGGKSSRGDIKRWERAVRIIQKELDEDWEKDPFSEDHVLILRKWEGLVFPPELVLAFYREFVPAATAGKKKRAEQLILIESRETGEEDGGHGADSSGSGGKDILKAVYHGYNYVTVITEEPAQYGEIQEDIYEDTGLMIRCAPMDRGLRFQEKRTIVLDMGERLPECYKNFPDGILYLDAAETKNKKRMLAARCSGITYVSLANILDTALHNTV